MMTKMTWLGKRSAKRLAVHMLGAGLLALGACSNETPESTAPAAESGGDFLVVANRPNNLNLVDLTTREVVRSCEVPGDFGPGTVVMSPDRQIAYVLTNRFENVYGIDIDTCEVRFSAMQSEGHERVKSIASLAISPDGKELYTHQNPTKLLVDRYEVQDSRVAVFDTSAGLDVKPVRLLPAPRQVTIMAAGDDGTLYMGGRDIHAMDVKTGDTRIALPSQSRNDPLESLRDSLTVWPIGDLNNALVRMYSAALFKDETQDMATAEWVWGYERINLETGESESEVFGPLETVLFSGMSRPSDRNQFFGVLTQLKKFDVAQKKELMSVDLDHSYYCINFSTDGSEIYLAGTYNDIAIYDPDTLEKKGNIQLPGGDMSMAVTRVFKRTP